MLSTLTVVLPVFALIFVGWLARKTNMLGAGATSELNRFVVWLALPALLFDIIAHAQWREIFQPDFILVSGIGMLVIFALTVVIRLRGNRHLADAAIDALNSSYANTGFMGFPLVLVFLGQDAMAPTLVATILTVCVLFAVAIILIETGLQSEVRKTHLVAKVVKSLCRNPLLVSPAIAMLIPVSGITLPQSVDVFLKLLGGAASPCALIALGLFLASKTPERQTSAGKTVGLLVTLKLVVHPLLTWFLATKVFALPPLLTHTAVLLAALPTGTGPFMLAEFYRREAVITARVVLVSTILSLLSVTAYLSWQ
ncbi:AEC family transporter [Erwinia sp. V71]|uniref:AEC family transporter n=1 Tax=Erwinia sp. V71 TaxID=3369424 RepID=UPI003F5FE530